MKKVLTMLLFAAFAPNLKAQVSSGSVKKDTLPVFVVNCCKTKTPPKKTIVRYVNKYITIDTQVRKELNSYESWQANRDAVQDQNDAVRDQRISSLELSVAHQDTVNKIQLIKDALFIEKFKRDDEELKELKRQQDEIQSLENRPATCNEQPQNYSDVAPNDGYAYHKVDVQGVVYATQDPLSNVWIQVGFMALADGLASMAGPMIWSNGLCAQYNSAGAQINQTRYSGNSPFSEGNGYSGNRGYSYHQGDYHQWQGQHQHSGGSGWGHHSGGSGGTTLGGSPAGGPTTSGNGTTLGGGAGGGALGGPSTSRMTTNRSTARSSVRTLGGASRSMGARAMSVMSRGRR